MEGVVLGAAAVIVGLSLIIYGIYCKFFRRLYPNPKYWIKVKTRIVANHVYDSKEPSSPGNPLFFKKQPHKRSESVIEYKVNGKSYRKTIDSIENGSIYIYCKKKNPDYFKTADEIKSRHYMDKHKASFLSSLITGIILIILGVVFISLGTGELSHNDYSITVYPPQ